MKVGIFIINYNGYTNLGQIFIESVKSFCRMLSSSYHNIGIELWLVDNGSTDGSTYKAKKICRELKIIKLHKNLGYGSAFNIAVRFTTEKLHRQYDLLICSNNDIVIDEEPYWKFIKTCIFLYENFPNGFLATPLLRNGYTGNLDTGGSFIDNAGLTWGFYLVTRDPLKIAHWLSHRPHCVDYADGAFLAMPASIINTLGLFDSRLFVYYEDVEISLRGWAKGTPSILVPVIIGKHYRSTTARKSPVALYHYTRNRLLVTYRYLGPTSFFKLLMYHLFYPFNYIFRLTVDSELINISTNKLGLKYVARAIIDAFLEMRREPKFESWLLLELKSDFSDFINRKKLIARKQEYLKAWLLERRHKY